MSVPWYGWVGIAAVAVAGVYVVSNAVAQPAALPVPMNPVPGSTDTPAVNADAELARGLTGLFTQVARDIGGKIARDDAARERQRERDAEREDRYGTGKDFDGDGTVSVAERNRSASAQD